MTRTTIRPDRLSEPKRALRSDFTAYTMRQAAIARRRVERKKQAITYAKDIFSIKSTKYIRTAPGAALALAIVATGGAGVYALTNWFGGDVTVSRPHPSVLSIDLSDCKGPLPAGVDSLDRSKVQFKILGDKHISEADLQRALLAQCELDAVRAFYAEQPLGQGLALYSGVITEMSDSTVTLSYQWASEHRVKSFSVAQDMTVYDQGKPAALADMQVGDTIVFAIKLAATPQEDRNPIDDASEVQSFFRTYTDTRLALGSAKKGFYTDSNIMPLDWYKQTNK